MQKPIVIFIAGPTSSGKTAVAVELADKINGEIISCDSMQIYEGMDILTQVPSENILNKVKHHLIKFIPPENEYNVSQYVKDANSSIENILRERRVPVVTGGTGLYMRSLLDGIFECPAKDDILREELKRVSIEEGRAKLHLMLQKIDPETAEKLHYNDIRRVIRAIEVYKLTGRKMSAQAGGEGGVCEKYDCRVFGLSLPREILYERIEKAVDRMFSEGLVEEAEHLMDRKLSITASKVLGLNEISMLKNGIITVEEASELIKKNTRRYAKRQLTWLRGEKRIEWVDGNREPDIIAGEIAGKIQKRRTRDEGR